jgi:hypothetical protein
MSNTWTSSKANKSLSGVKNCPLPSWERVCPVLDKYGNVLAATATSAYCTDIKECLKATNDTYSKNTQGVFVISKNSTGQIPFKKWANTAYPRIVNPSLIC